MNITSDPLLMDAKMLNYNPTLSILVKTDKDFPRLCFLLPSNVKWTQSLEAFMGISLFSEHLAIVNLTKKNNGKSEEAFE